MDRVRRTNELLRSPCVELMPTIMPLGEQLRYPRQLLLRRSQPNQVRPSTMAHPRALDDGPFAYPLRDVLKQRIESNQPRLGREALPWLHLLRRGCFLESRCGSRGLGGFGGFWGRGVDGNQVVELLGIVEEVFHCRFAFPF